MEHIKQIEFDFYTVSLRDDDIIEHRFDWEKPYVVEARDIVNVGDSMVLLAGGKKKAILSIAGLYGSMSPEAREVDISRANNYTLALGLVIHNLSQRLLANFYFKIKTLDYPVKTFKSEEEAVTWLYQQIRLNKAAI